MKSLIFIASTGYSGSTLLEMILGSVPGMANLGELYKLTHYYASGTALCTCGTPVCDCEFWETVQNELRSSTGNPDLSLGDYSLHPPRKGKIPSPADLALFFGNRAQLEAMSGVSSRAKKLLESGENTKRLYEAVCKITDSHTIVDSSKESSILRNLYLTVGDKMKVIFLVRDGRAATNSFMKNDSLTVNEAASFWSTKNKKLLVGLSRIPSELVYNLHYETLCTDTEAELERLGNFLGQDISKANRTLEKQGYCTVGGNPMRFRRDESEIRLDEKWKERLTASDLQVIERIAGKINRRLGYPMT